MITAHPRAVTVAGVGMHPWGKWGRSFVQYGVHAARQALGDAGVPWTDVDLVVGGETVRNGYAGYVAGSTFAQALGWNGARIATSYAACATGAQALDTARARILAGPERRVLGDPPRHDRQAAQRREVKTLDLARRIAAGRVAERRVEHRAAAAGQQAGQIGRPLGPDIVPLVRCAARQMGLGDGPEPVDQQGHPRRVQHRAVAQADGGRHTVRPDAMAVGRPHEVLRAQDRQVQSGLFEEHGQRQRRLVLDFAQNRPHGI